MKHPAKYSKPLLPIFAELLLGYEKVLDPFAGTGLIHTLESHDTYGVEIEPEWAEMHPRTVVGDALALPFGDGFFDAVCTSPTYGNRMADHHEAKDGSKRCTYRHMLGRPLHPNNSGGMQWGPEYRAFHECAWAEVWRVLRPGGRFVLNVKDHIRKGERQDVSAFHLRKCAELGFDLVSRQDCYAVTGNNFGAFGFERVPYESVYALDKP